MIVFTISCAYVRPPSAGFVREHVSLPHQVRNCGQDTRVRGMGEGKRGQMNTPS